MNASAFSKNAVSGSEGNALSRASACPLIRRSRVMARLFSSVERSIQPIPIGCSINTRHARALDSHHLKPLGTRRVSRQHQSRRFIQGLRTGPTSRLAYSVGSLRFTKSHFPLILPHCIRIPWCVTRGAVAKGEVGCLETRVWFIMEHAI